MKILSMLLITYILAFSVVLSSEQQVDNKVLVLDGIDDRIETVFAPSAAPKDNFTIEVWVKPSAPINNPEQAHGGTSNHGCIIYPEHGKAMDVRRSNVKQAGVGLSVGQNGVIVFEQSNYYGLSNHKVALLVKKINIEKWTHIAIVFANKQPVLYIDGEFAARGITSSKIVRLLARQIGGNKEKLGNYSGMIDELMLWNRSLSFKEIKKHVKNKITGNESGLILYYDFNRIDGDGTFLDLSYKGHKGMLMNGISIEEHRSVFSRDVIVASKTKQDQKISDIDSITKNSKIKRPDGIAVIIGIEKYKNAPPATFAKADALMFEKYANKLLGIPTENIYTITNEAATLGEFMKLFGKNGYLKRRTNENTEIFIYYSGHVAPDLETKMPYLIPSDVDPDYPTTGYSTKKLYENLSSLNAKSITIFLDACFSGATRSNEMLLANARPVRIEWTKSAIPENLTVMTASSGAQISSGYPKEGHGLFSYYLMKGLQKYSDKDLDSKITIEELYNYIKVNVSKTAGQLDREQTPELFTKNNRRILVEY